MKETIAAWRAAKKRVGVCQQGEKGRAKGKAMYAQSKAKCQERRERGERMPNAFFQIGHRCSGRRLGDAGGTHKCHKHSAPSLPDNTTPPAPALPRKKKLGGRGGSPPCLPSAPAPLSSKLPSFPSTLQSPGREEGRQGKARELLVK